MALTGLGKRIGMRKSGADAPLVVVIDDEESVGRMLRMVLLRNKYRVEVFASAATGVTAVRALRPHAVVLDVEMPEHDGFWVFDRIREFNPDVPIIFNSAYHDSNQLADVSRGYRPFAYLLKNTDVGEFLQVVERAVQVSTGDKQRA